MFLNFVKDEVVYVPHALYCFELISKSKEDRPCLYYATGLPKWCKLVRTLQTMQKTKETRVRSLGWKDPLEKETATHSSILAWRIPWTDEPEVLQPMGSQRVGHN